MCYKKLALSSWLMLFTLIYFSYRYTLLFCWKIKSCSGHCFPQEIRPEETVHELTSCYCITFGPFF